MLGGGAAILGFGVYCATHSVDFPVYHRTAAQVLRGDYELYPTAIYAGDGVVSDHSFRYAPAIAFLFSPLALLPLGAAAFLFFLAKVGGIVYAGSVVRRYMRDPNSARSLILTSLLLTAGYAIEEFHYGNFHVLAVALMVYAFDSVESGRPIRAAAALAIAIATKLTPLLLLTYFAWRRRFRVCLATLVVLLILAFLPPVVVGYRMNNHLLEGFAKYALQKIDTSDNYSLRGVFLSTGFSSAVVTWAWVLTVLSGALVVLVALRRHPAGPTTRFLEFCVVLTAILLGARRSYTTGHARALPRPLRASGVRRRGDAHCHQRSRVCRAR